MAHVHELVIATEGAAKRSPTGAWVADQEAIETLRAALEPTCIHGPYGDGKVRLVFRPPPEGFDAEEAISLCEALV